MSTRHNQTHLLPVTCSVLLLLFTGILTRTKTPSRPLLLSQLTTDFYPLMPTAAMWVQL